jgi:hypothetical protein
MYLINLETVRNKIRLWIIRVESYYQIYKGVMLYNSSVFRKKCKITQVKNHIKEHKVTKSLQAVELIPNLIPKEKSIEIRVNENNLIKRSILGDHYSCLENGSLVQDQFKQRPKNLSGSQRITQVSSNAYEGLQSHLMEKNEKEEILEGESMEISIKESENNQKKQSMIVQYAESLEVYKDSLEKDQLELRPKKPSGSQQIDVDEEFEVEEKILFFKRNEEPKEIIVETNHIGLYQRVKRKIIELTKKLCNFVWKKRPSMFPPDPEAEGKISGINAS